MIIQSHPTCRWWWYMYCKCCQGLHEIHVLLRWTPVCWAALVCWTRLLSSAASRPTKYHLCSQHPRAPRTTWSLPDLSGPPTAMSSSWPTMERSTGSWCKPDPGLQLSQASSYPGQTWTCFMVFAPVSQSAFWILSPVFVQIWGGSGFHWDLLHLFILKQSSMWITLGVLIFNMVGTKNLALVRVWMGWTVIYWRPF